MDFVTHAAVGALAGRAVAPAVPRAARWGALAALAPDVDHALEWSSAQAYLLQHRTWSHSLLVLSLGVAASAIPGGERRSRVAVVVAALVTHLVLDLSTPFGTGVGWPYTSAMPAWDLLPIVCPWLMVLSVLLAAWTAHRGRREPGMGGHAARVSLGVLCAFLALEAGVAGYTRAAAPDAALAVPDWRVPVRGSALRVEGDDVVCVTVRPWGGISDERVPGRALPWGLPPAGAEAWVGRFRVPVVQERPDGVAIIDAQFWLVAPDRPPFEIVQRRTPDGALGPPRLQMHPRGLQPLLWLAVLLASLWLTRQGGDPQAPSAESNV